MFDAFTEQTTLYQAFQFAFGHDTDAPEADVTVTLQRYNGDQVEHWNFKHRKIIVDGMVEVTFGIQTEGVDDYYRVRFSDLFHVQ